MIHNSSSDPVLIKKISLKIWSLRDEIEARITNKLAEQNPSEKLNLTEMRAEYTPRELKKNNVLSLTPSTEIDPGEAEMARAMMETSDASEETEVPKETEAAAPEEVTPLDEAGTPATDPEIDNVVNLSPQQKVLNIDQNFTDIRYEPPVMDESKIARAKTVLSEINMNKMFFFCNVGFTEGQSIVIQFCIPKSFIVNGTILYCRPFNLKSRIISQNNYTHRTLIQFNFLKEGERGLLREFLQSIEPVIVKVTKKGNGTDTAASNSDFSELDDLGL